MSSKTTITVAISERVAELMPDVEITGDDSVYYSWEGGYETLRIRRPEGGGLEYRGVYHPDGVCEGGGICRWCGRTLEFE